MHLKLIEKGINVNNQNLFGETALHWAGSLWSEYDLLDSLLEAKANVDLCDKKGISPLIKCCTGFNEYITNKLLRRSNLDNIEKNTTNDYFTADNSFVDRIYRYKMDDMLNQLKLLYRNSVLESIADHNTKIGQCFASPISELNIVDIIIDLVY